MTFSQTSKIFGSILGLALLGLSQGCSSVPGLGQLPSLSEYRAEVENPHAEDADYPAGFVPDVKLPAKDPHAFGIGVVLPVTLSHHALAQSLRNGLALAVADVNAAGGINGQPIQLDVLNSGPDALPALRDRGEAVILVGDPSLAVAQAPQLANYPQLIGFLCDYVSVPKLTPKNGIRLYLNGDQEARAIESYLEAAGVDQVTIVHTNDLPGESHRQYMSFLISGNHSIVAAAEGYTPGEHDFTLLAKAVYRSGHDALVLAGNGFEYPNILAAFDSAAWTGVVLGYAGNSGLTPLAGAGRLEQTAAYPLPEFATNPRSTGAGRAFADKYLAKYGEDPGLPAAYGYDNIRALAAAATQANSSDPNKIRASFIALRAYVGAVGRYDIKDDGDTEMPLRLWLAGGQPAPTPHASAAPPAPADMQKLPFQSFSTPAQP